MALWIKQQSNAALETSYCTLPIYVSSHFDLLGLSKTDSALAKVVHAVIPSQESISQNGQGANRLREIHAHKGAHARARNLKGVVESAQREVVAIQDKMHVRQRGTLVTVHGVLTSKGLVGANLLVTSMG